MHSDKSDLLLLTGDTASSHSLMQWLQQTGYESHCTVVGSVAAAEAGLRQLPTVFMLDAGCLAGGVTCGQLESLLQACSLVEARLMVYGPWQELPSDTVAWLHAQCHVWLREPLDVKDFACLWGYEAQLASLQQQLQRQQCLVQEKELELEEGLLSAAYIQKSLVPQTLPQLPYLQTAATFMPCYRVGGDLFNVLRLDEDTVMFYVLDVSGHGVSAAMVTVAIYQSLSLHSSQLLKRYLDIPPYYKITPPDAVLRKLDALFPFERFEKFFTIFYMLLQPSTGRIQYCNAAHPAPLLLRANGDVDYLQPSGTVVGMGGAGALSARRKSLVSRRPALYAYRWYY